MNQDKLSEEQRWREWEKNTNPMREALAAPNISNDYQSAAPLSPIAEAMAAPERPSEQTPSEKKDDSAEKKFKGRPYPW